MDYSTNQYYNGMNMYYPNYIEGYYNYLNQMNLFYSNQQNKYVEQINFMNNNIKKNNKIKNNKINKKKKEDIVYDDISEIINEFNPKECSLEELIIFSSKLQKKVIKKNTVPYLLSSIYSELIELNNMVGLEDIKTELIDFIFHYIQNQNTKDLTNFLICGDPGVGKTTLAKIIGKILSKLNIVKNNITVINATDVCGAFIGETNKKTKSLIESSPGVIIVDEIYSIAGPSGSKDFGHEFANAIIADIEKQSSLKKQEKRIYIFMGYKEETEEFLFRKNKGLISRFPFKFTIKSVSNNYLKELFLNKLEVLKYDKKNKKILNYIDNIFSNENSIGYFPANGRSVENLITLINISVSRDIFNDSKQVTLKDLEIGFEKYKKSLNLKENTDFFYYT